MPGHEVALTENVTLVDAVDHLLNRGVLVSGRTTLSLAGVDLVYVGLNLLLSSVQTLRQRSGETHQSVAPAGVPKGTMEAPLAGRPHPSPLPPGEREQIVGLRTVGYTPVLESPSLAGPNGHRGSMVAEPAVLSLTEGSPDAAENPAKGLARLVLALVELLRQLMERQAVRGLEGNRLSESEVERMGLALMELEVKMAELRAVFGLEEADLSLDLGPLGRLL